MLEVDALTSAIGVIKSVVERACLADEQMFDKLDEPRSYKDRMRPSFSVYLGTDRASMSLYLPLENIEATMVRYTGDIMNYAARAR